MNIDPWLRDLIAVAPYTGRDGNGDETFGSVVTGVPALVEATTQLVRNPTGDEVQSKHVILTKYAIGLLDRVWLPGVSSSDAKLAERAISIKSANCRSRTGNVYEVYL